MPLQILDADQMRRIDRRAIDRFGIPSIVLMENAALAVIDVIGDHFPDIERVSVFCGPGQNGGDGFAIARHLENRGVVPSVFVVGERAKFTGDARTNLDVCEHLGIPIHDVTDDASLDEALVHAADADLLVDALFGTGLNRAPEGIFASAIEAMNGLTLPIVAVDVPSGVSASSHEAFVPSIQAAVTVTFALPKICHVFDPAATQCGEVVVADISIPHRAAEEEGVRLALTTPADLAPVVAARHSETHKGTYGHVGIVAGTLGRAGAAVLCARGAIRTGAGLVSVVTEPESAPIVHAGSVESMTHPVPFEVASIEGIVAFLAKKDAILIGPGLRDDDASYDFVRALTGRLEQPLVIDASALNAFAGRTAELNPRGFARILTPHPGELGRLLGRDAASVNADRITVAREAAAATRCFVVLKGHQTLVASPDGEVRVNPTGNPGMASGGMGDVLGGVIAALLARGEDPMTAATAGVYLHGLAGDLVAEEIGDTGLAALDVANALPRAIQRARG